MRSDGRPDRASVSDEAKEELVREFPELKDLRANLSKEVYAHFGLVFFSFSLIEHSLINAVTFDGAFKEGRRKKIRTQSEWEHLVDKHFARATKATLGTLIKGLSGIREYDSVVSRLDAANRKRNYLVHHFFREEIAYFSSNEGLWFLLSEIMKVRREVESIEPILGECFARVCARIGLPKPTEDQLRGAMKEMELLGHKRVISGDTKVGW